MRWTPTVVGGSDELPSAKHPLSSIETYGYRRRKARNPLRLHVDHVRKAVTEANKLEHDPDDVELIRRGAESARLLADNLARAVGGAQSPKEATASEAIPGSDNNSGHARAFRDLEGRLSDCETMAGIGSQIIANARGVDGEVVFVVTHTRDMLTKLKADYYAAYHGERDMPL